MSNMSEIKNHSKAYWTCQILGWGIYGLLNTVFLLQYIEKIEPYFQGSLKLFLKGGYEIEIFRRQTQKFRERLSL